MQRHLAPFDGLLGQVGYGAVRLGAAEEVGHVAQLLQGLRTCLQRAGRDGGTLRAGRRQGGAGGSHSRNRHRRRTHRVVQGAHLACEAFDVVHGLRQGFLGSDKAGAVGAQFGVDHDLPGQQGRLALASGGQGALQGLGRGVAQGALELLQSELVAGAAGRFIGLSLQQRGVLARQGEIVQAVDRALAGLRNRQRGGQADHALQQPAHVADALLVVAVVGDGVQGRPVTRAQLGTDLQPARQTAVALGQGPGFGQPHGQAQVFRAGAQQGFAGAGHAGPVGHLEAGDPFTLVERGVIGAPHFVDGVKLRRE